MRRFLNNNNNSIRVTVCMTMRFVGGFVCWCCFVCGWWWWFVLTVVRVDGAGVGERVRVHDEARLHQSAVQLMHRQPTVLRHHHTTDGFVHDQRQQDHSSLQHHRLLPSFLPITTLRLTTANAHFTTTRQRSNPLVPTATATPTTNNYLQTPIRRSFT